MKLTMKGVSLALLFVLAFGACTQERVDEAHVGVRYTDGEIEGQKFDKVVAPGGAEWVFNDHVYKLPARQVTYISGSQEGADAPPLVLTAKNGEKMNVELTVRFFLNSREEALKPFFLEICQKHDCWEDEGWITMLNETFGNPQQAVINDIGLDYDAEELRYNNAVKDDFADTFASTFVTSLGRLVGRDDYFCGPGYDREDESSCPGLSVEVNSVTYANTDLEGFREAAEVAEGKVELSVQEEAAAAAQARVDAARATPEALALQEARAILLCAENPEGCSLSVTRIEGGNDVGVSVPAN